MSSQLKPTNAATDMDVRPLLRLLAELIVEDHINEQAKKQKNGHSRDNSKDSP